MCHCAQRIIHSTQQKAEIWRLHLQWGHLQLDWRECSQFGRKSHRLKAIVQSRPSWMRIWDILSLRKDVKISHYRVQNSPQLPGTGKPPCGQATASQPIAVPLKCLLTTVFRNWWLARWTIGLILCSFPAWILRRAMVLAVDHRSKCRAKPCCSLQNLGASPGPGAALACSQLGTDAGSSSGCRQTGPQIQPRADTTLANPPVRWFSEGLVTQFALNFLLLPNFSECSRGNKLRTQNISNHREDEGKILFLWPNS